MNGEEFVEIIKKGRGKWLSKKIWRKKTGKFKMYRSILITTFNCFFCIAIISCDANTQNSESSKSGSDTVIKDIPKFFDSDHFKKIKNDILSKAGLPDIENGFDSLQIRIWLGYVFKNQEQVLVLKKQDDGWSGEFIDLFFNYSGKHKLDSINKQVKDVRPISGWNEFITKLYQLDFLTLPDDSKISNYSSDADGDGVTVEIATKDKYRIYSYQSPGIREDSIPEAKKIENILQLIEDELGVKRLRNLK